jgi:hypothetical protein
MKPATSNDVGFWGAGLAAIAMDGGWQSWAMLALALWYFVAKRLDQ